MQRQVNRSIVPLKLVYLVIATVCIMIGLVGLIIPVIPGILFLMVAVYYLGKVSRRVRNWSDKCSRSWAVCSMLMFSVVSRL